MDLSDITLNDGILLISAIPTPTLETLYETHSEYERGWLNTGNWQGSHFLADYTQCTPEPDCFSGQTKIGPFTHYPGTPSYTGYTTWLDENTQYVKTSYTAHVNEYPAQVQYTINTGEWTTFTANLQSGTASTTIPESAFTQGTNTLQFQESNTYPTQFTWTLYIDQGATPEEYTNSCTYDQHGNMLSLTDARGNTIHFDYDSSATYLTSITNALDHSMTATYDFDTGKVMAITDPEGSTTSFEYDISGRVTKKTHPDSSELEAIYNDSTNTVTLYDELDHKTVKQYDGLGRLTDCRWYLSETQFIAETYTYNHQDKIITVTDPEGYIYSSLYDSRGRLVRQINPNGTHTEIQYEDATNTKYYWDENQHRTDYHYDWTGNVLWVKEYTDPVNYYLTEYTYDAGGNVLSVTDANHHTTYYTHSLFGPAHILYPDSTSETITYDEIGKCIQTENALGVTTYTYNEIYQLTGIDYPDQSLTFTYDGNGNRILMTDATGSTTSTYDTRNRLISESRSMAGQIYTVEYGYDVASRVTSVMYPDQTTLFYEYDSLNRLTEIPGFAHFSYTDNSLLSSAIYANGVTTSFQYDTKRRPLTISAQRNSIDLLLLNYSYDAGGNITHLAYDRLQDQQWTESAETFSYDWLDRLISAQGPYGSYTYTYDPVGNRLSHNDLFYTYNEMNELLSTSDGTTFSYDAVGNLTEKQDGNTIQYTYTAHNQLSRIEKDHTIQSELYYDGTNQRVKKTEWIESLSDYQTIISLSSGSNTLYEKNTQTGCYALYIYGPQGKIARKVDGLTDYYHTDHTGSTRLITSESGSVVTDVSYDPFGEPILSGEAESYLFTGKEQDASQLYYYGARYYDPHIGRFITRDILPGAPEKPQFLNKYSYCLNNPLRYVDPTGHESEVPDQSKDPQEIVEEIFSQLQNVDPAELQEIQELIDEGEYLEALKNVCDLLGYDVKENDEWSLNITIGEEEWTIYATQTLIVNGEPAYGNTNPENNTIIIRFTPETKIGDVALTVLHEVCHAVLGGTTDEQIFTEHQLIYSAEYSCMASLIWFDVEFSDKFIGHIDREAKSYDSFEVYRFPITKIINNWIVGWKKW
jgi:RHS repeat-associated protein